MIKKIGQSVTIPFLNNQEGDINIINYYKKVLQKQLHEHMARDAGYNVNYIIIDETIYDSYDDIFCNIIIKAKVKYKTKVIARPIIILEDKDKDNLNLLYAQIEGYKTNNGKSFNRREFWK